MRTQSRREGRTDLGQSPRGDKAGTQGPGLPRGRIWLWFLSLLFINFFLGKALFPGPEAPGNVPYTLFKQEVAKDNVQAIFGKGETIAGRFREPVTYPSADSQAQSQPRQPSKPVIMFATTLPSFVDPGLEAFLIDHGVEIGAKPIQQERSPVATLFFRFGPAMLFIVFYILLFRRSGRSGGGLMGIGKNRARRYDLEQDPKVTFYDMAGIDEAETELVEIVDFRKEPATYTRLGGTAPKRVLLIGAPRTGKTLLARAVPGEAGVVFFAMSAAEFVEMIDAEVRRIIEECHQEARILLDAHRRQLGPVAVALVEQETLEEQEILKITGLHATSGRDATSPSPPCHQLPPRAS